MSLTNLELEELGKNMKIYPSVKVLLQTELTKNKINPKNGNYIINLTDNVELNGGTHWVALCVKNNKAVYFDSFAGPADLDILLFMKEIKQKGYNQKIIQAIESSLCGWYCLGFLYYCQMMSDKQDVLTSANSFTHFFKDDTDINASIIRRLILSWMNKKRIRPYLISKLNEKIKYT